MENKIEKEIEFICTKNKWNDKEKNTLLGVMKLLTGFSAKTISDMTDEIRRLSSRHAYLL